jgi:hypothetical protein
VLREEGKGVKKEELGKGRERKGCWTCSGGAFPHRRTAMEAVAVVLCSAVKKERKGENENVCALGFGQ